MKRILRFTSLCALLAGTQFFLTGCATPGTTSTSLEVPTLKAELLATGSPVEIDFDSHLFYGDLEVTTTEHGTKRVVLNTEDDAVIHNAGFFWRISGDLDAGDAFMLTLTARTLEGGPLSFPVMVEKGEAPWTKSAMETLHFDNQSRSRSLVGVLEPETVGIPIHVNLHLGQLNGVLEIESLEMVRLRAASPSASPEAPPAEVIPPE